MRTPAGPMAETSSSWEESALRPGHQTGSTLRAGLRSHSTSSTGEQGEKLEGKISTSVSNISSCSRFACVIGLQDTFLMTGGVGTEKQVTLYNEKGFLDNLPSLNQGRYDHGCGHYINDEQKLVNTTANKLLFMT